MAASKQAFRGFWHGENLPRHAQFCLASFLDRGDRFVLYAYRKIDVPFGVELRDAAECLPESEIFYYRTLDGSRGSISGFANLFRYVLLNREGGWWVDVDVLRLQAPLPDAEAYFGWESDERIGNAVVKLPPNTPFLLAAEQETRGLGGEAMRGQTGPALITRLIKQMNLAEQARPSGEVYPIHPEDFACVARAADAERLALATAGKPFLHLWSDMFLRRRSSAIDAPERGSFLDQKFREHGALGRRARRFVAFAGQRLLSGGL